jgi:hypothetical protein
LRFIHSSARFAQANSSDRIAMPRGMKMNAGPGRAIIAMPARMNTEPMSVTSVLRMRRSYFMKKEEGERR